MSAQPAPFTLDLLGAPIPVPLSEPEFLAAMARRFAERARMPLTDALTAAQATMDAHLYGGGLVFGAEGFDWTEAGARELADEELSYWGDR